MKKEGSQDLKFAEKGVWLSIIAYLFLAALQIALASLVHSDALRANGFNSLTDIFGNIALLIGLKMARIPADNNHVYGHWKAETIASLISSFIMAFVAFDLLRDLITNFFKEEKASVDYLGAWIGIFSALIMFSVYFYNRQLAKKINSSALVSTYKDNLSDALISLSTAFAIFTASFQLPIIDSITAIIICCLIFKTAYDIFKDATFSLTDGFDDNLLDDYKKEIEKVTKIKSVKSLRGRNYGANIFLDVVVEMSADMSVDESHEATESIEKLLAEQFNIFDTDVHVEPAELPKEERVADLSLFLLEKEEQLLEGENLTSTNFKEINAQGMITQEVTLSNDGIKNFKAKRLSRRSFILTYKSNRFIFTSIWRREETWLCSYRQITEIKNS
ncbi:MAG: cation diffusion facilitator family transporter [Lactovum sp.]